MEKRKSITISFFVLLCFSTPVCAHGEAALAFYIPLFSAIALGIPFILDQPAGGYIRGILAVTLAGTSIVTVVVAAYLMNSKWHMDSLYRFLVYFLGMAAAPIVSSAVVAYFLRRRKQGPRMKSDFR
ncbi:hypothetical protein [Candidatus Thiodictyon syntrophicum]|jgi:uncharacterized membrane protein AbrB (regulator of aidB expression)|uniref:hypothetical protein n=1 Tax=Candidatus Thiodictyon syntrophicum TaxID=1166950 RepID=UPI0012FE5F35|nr:hypothetical protein [Candidatus Thiodictyon syntrophicum]